VIRKLKRARKRHDGSLQSPRSVDCRPYGASRAPSRRILEAWPSVISELAPAIPPKIHGPADARDLRRQSDHLRLVGRVVINLLMVVAEEVNDKAPRIIDVARLKSDVTQRIDRAAGVLEATAVKLELSRCDKTLRCIDAPSITGP
jgi:hypothetical protein